MHVTNLTGTVTNYPICNSTNNPNNCPILVYNYVNIPDTSFGKFLIAQYPSCLYKDASNLYWMDTTCSGVVSTTKINWATNLNIKNIEGIQYFKNLDSLSITKFSKLDSIHQLPANLKYLKAVSCIALKVFDSLPVTLTSFNCDTNSLVKLPILPNGLQYLSCRFNFLHNTITNLPAALTYFDCSDNLITTLPSSLPNSLQTLIVARNAGIQCLPQLPNTLTQLNVANTQVACLPNMPNNLITSLSVCNGSNNPNGCAVLPNTYVNIPDSFFRFFLINNYPTCFNATKQMDTTCNGILNATLIDCSNLYISNLQGVQYFKNLQGLVCSYNQLTSLPSLPSGLTLMRCYSNNLDSLPQLPSSLIQLTCGSNQLKRLPILPNGLNLLSCDYNQIDSLPSLPPNLNYLSCRGNQLKSLPTLANTLQYLFVSVNQLKILPLLPSVLLGLECSKNNLDSLPVLPNLLEYLDCSYNNISVLPTLSGSLKTFYCSQNLISNLPLLPNGLWNMRCDNNQIVNMPLLPNTLSIIQCNNNLLTNLPQLPSALTTLYCYNNAINCFPKLPTLLITLYTDSSYINCIPNIPNANFNIYNTKFFTDTTRFFRPICNPTNNANQCQAFPTVAGRVFTDNNSNGIKDANEFYRPFVKELASNGDATFSNLNGAFAFSFDSTGSYSLKTIAPKYFKAVPDSNSFSFANNNVYIAVPDIALQPIAVNDSLAIVVTPLNSRARPGFSFPYHLGYANAGTTNLYTTISFTYDTSRLMYDSSSVAIISNTNNLIVISIDSLVAGEGRYAKLYFTVKPTAVIGDTLFAFANAVSIATTATSANATIIRGSFDPNDKVATPQLTPTQVANGDWIEYTIRFQNTGNDTAVNVVLADTLSSLLQSGYFNVIATSHLANLTYSFKNNIVYFEFLNINLPDSATNYSGSQGWITFKVKPLAGVAVGTYIDNKASIYFDYNKPIVTNIARTLISTIVPVKLLSYSLRLTQGDKKVVENIWSTANEINASHFNIQRSIDGVNFKTVGQVKAVGVSTYSFIDNSLNSIDKQKTIFYRLQMVDNDGRFEYSPIREINLQPSISNIRLYPNPTKDMVTIECANAKEILITDYLGRIIYRSTVNRQQTTVGLKQFKKGIYLVQVVLDNGNIVNGKLILE